MAAPLNTFTTVEQHGVVRFLWAKGMAGKDIHKEMQPMYGEHCLSRHAVHNWVQKLSEGKPRIEDEHRVGRPVKEQSAHGSNSNHKNFYAAGFQGLVKRWDKCLNLYGDHVEK